MVPACHFHGVLKGSLSAAGPFVLCVSSAALPHFNVRSYFTVRLRDMLFVCLGFVLADSHSPHAAEAAHITLLFVPLRQDVHVLGVVTIRNLFKSDSIKSANMGEGTFTLQWY